MFEILKALMAMREACEEHDRGFWFDIQDGSLKVEVVVTPDDVEFIDQMRQLVGA